MAVSEVLEVLKQPTDTCEILGRVEKGNYGVIDARNPGLGIFVEYGGGDTCTNSEIQSENGLPRKAKFMLFCDSNQEENVV